MYKVSELLAEMPSKRLLLRYLRHQSQLDGVRQREREREGERCDEDDLTLPVCHRTSVL